MSYFCGKFCGERVALTDCAESRVRAHAGRGDLTPRGKEASSLGARTNREQSPWIFPGLCRVLRDLFCIRLPNENFRHMLKGSILRAFPGAAGKD